MVVVVVVVATQPVVPRVLVAGEHMLRLATLLSRQAHLSLIRLVLPVLQVRHRLHQVGRAGTPTSMARVAPALLNRFVQKVVRAVQPRGRVRVVNKVGTPEVLDLLYI